MSTREIDRTEWKAFFDHFSKAHPATEATVQIIGPDLGAQEEVSRLPFSGLSYDEKGSDRNTITLFLGTEAEDHVEHRVDEPTRVWNRTEDGGASGAVDIEAADGSKTILTLRPFPALPG